MKFSTRTLYGLKAVLVLASRYGEGSLSVSQIATKEGISSAYLEQILNTLKKKGLVKSVRGPQGGYVLSKKPSDVTLEALFYALEDESAAAWPANGVPKTGADEVAIGNFIFWKKLQSSLTEGLSDISLKELIDEARRVKKTKPAHSAYAFHI